MTLKIGSQGLDVGALQKALNANGASLLEDDSLGDVTANAAIAYAVSKLLPNTPVVNTPRPPKPLSATRIKGFDGYSGDVITSFTDMLQGGVVWTYLKATEGLSYRDAAFPHNLAAAKAAGIVSGSYHFVHMDAEPVLQATQFVAYSLNAGIGPEDFMVLDYETASGDPYSVTGDLIWIKSFLETVKTQAHKRCWIYCGQMTRELVGDTSFLLEYPVILANYNPESKISPPQPWPAMNAWQMSGNSRIPGVKNLGDSDVFFGDINDLKAVVQYCNL